MLWSSLHRLLYSCKYLYIFFLPGNKCINSFTITIFKRKTQQQAKNSSIGGKEQLVTYLPCLQWLESVDLLIEAKLGITDHNSAGTYGYYPCHRGFSDNSCLLIHRMLQKNVVNHFIMTGSIGHFRPQDVLFLLASEHVESEPHIKITH